MKKEYKIASELLDDIWRNIDWSNMNKGRMLKIWNEFENQVRALSKCYSRLEPFIEKICKRFNSRVTQLRTSEILDECDNDVILDIFRYETQIPILLLRLKREEAKERFEMQQEALKKEKLNSKKNK